MKQLRLSRLLSPFAGVVLLVVLVTAACGNSGREDGASGGSEVKSVTLALPADDVAFYGYFVADDLGFFEEEGLDLRLESVGGSSEVATLLAAGNIDIGEGAAGAMLPAIEQGASLHPFFTYQFGQIFDLVVPAGSDVDSIEDLRGRPVGISELAGGEVPLVKALLVGAGINPDEDVELVEVGYEPPQVLLAFERAKIEAYSSHKLDIAGLNAAGFETVSLVPEDVAELPGEGLLASEDAAEDLDLLAAVGRATAKGQLITLTNQEGAICSLKKYLPESFEEGGVGREFLSLLIDFAGPPQGDDGRYEFGAVNADGWNDYVDLYRDAGLVTQDIDMNDYVIADLFEEINDFDYDAVVEQAEGLSADC